MSGFLVGSPLIDPAVKRHNGGTSSLTLDHAGTTNSTLLFINGVAQVAGTDFNVSSTTLTTTTAIPAGTNIATTVQLAITGTVNVPADASVTEPKLAASGTPDGSLFLRDDMAWTAVGVGTGVQGMQFSRDTDTDHDINVTSGSCWDATGTVLMTLASEITKQSDASWAVGNDAGGMDTGAVGNSTGYYVWLIQRSDTGVEDVLFSLSGTAPTMPSNYDYKRMIGYCLTDASANWTPFFQQGNYFEYTPSTVYADQVSDSTITNLTYETGTLAAPRNSYVHLKIMVQNESATSVVNNSIMLRSTAGPSSTNTEHQWFVLETSSNSDQMYFSTYIHVDGNSQISYGAREHTGSALLKLKTVGFFMHNREVLE